ncbi:hypothetical protein [Mucilaginibacter dorajii]|uniref:Uncharacterized protein n=1 Tax=Mucilaginibacter dorajii TaxID=692994 RepID=A0ABP7QBD6_9SPHI|nr:hypothetical protein [Mucilaginibacter dorajii]MCS3733083.1 putative nuclease with TOPRIM domain [Mucilaginibacter dorajii]
MDKLTQRVPQLAKGMLDIKDKRFKILQTQLTVLEAKIENAEQKLFDDTINATTYKKWMKKFNAEKAKLNEEFTYLEDLDDRLQQVVLTLPYILNLPQVFADSSLNQQHTIIREVFKQGITYKEGMFRTPSINPEFIHNLLMLK